MPVDKTPNGRSYAGQDTSIQGTRRRRLRGACDACRTRKIKCNSAVNPGKVCTNCTLSDIPCTHEIPRRQKEKKMREMTAAYVETLETRIKYLEAYIQKLHPEENIDDIIETHIRDQSRSPSCSQAGPSGTHDFLCSTNLRLSKPRTDDDSTTDDDSDTSNEDLALAALTENMKRFTTATNASIEERYYGHASMFMLAKQLTDIKKEINGESNAVSDPNQYRRRIYWDLQPWEISYISAPEPPYIFPDTDLLNNLISLYFEKSYTLLPILHRPTFMRSLALGQHLWDSLFGMTVLLVCALGAKYSQDSRVTMFNDLSESGMSAGWHYFSQVQVYRKRMLHGSTIYDLQYYALAALYLNGTSMPQSTWTLVAVGLRHAFEKGVHRRKGPHQAPSADHELQKRAFWALICLDSAESSSVGRPCSVTLETYDLDYPIECDDEYWETGDPETSFRQPEGKPCAISAFVSFIKLCEILGFALRTLYSNKKSRLLSGFIGSKREGRMVAELDSSMNKWKDLLPEFLHWDSSRQDETFFHQSVILHATYNYTQILIHRPYLTRRSPLTPSSLAICSNAARTCSGILEAATARGVRVLPIVVMVAYTAGMVITLSLWGGKSLGYAGDSAEDARNLERCVRYLQACEKRWHPAGRLRDILTEAGVMHEHRPSSGVDPNSSQCTVPTYPAPYMTENVPIVQNTEPNAAEVDDDWDLRRLLLTEMGYLMEPNSASENAGALVNIAQADYGTYALQPDAGALSTGGRVQVSSASSAMENNDSIMNFWSDIISTPFTSLEEWDVYYRAHMSQP